MGIELLSPGGDMEKIRTAIYFGADAVYSGGPALHLRAKATSMELGELERAAKYVHTAGKKLYITVNAFARNRDFDALPDYLRALEEIGADAIIVSDIGVLGVAREAVPYLPVHISTQANCLNFAAANMYYRLGASRIILGRELSLEDIGILRDKTPPELELEAFVHGAMCVAYSGRCLLSAAMTGRDSNRGECAQPCRWEYSLVERKRPHQAFPIEQDGSSSTILSSRDLCSISFLDKIQAAGITSFKLEGRMKTAYYVATVTGAYRRALDGSADIAALERELHSASHREYSSGFYFGELEQGPCETLGYMQDCLFVGVVKHWEAGVLTLEHRNRFALGDTLEVVSPDSLGLEFKVETIQNCDGIRVDAATATKRDYSISCPYELHAGDMLRKRIAAQ